MVDREDIDALLIGALYGELAETDRARLEAHLASHPQDRLALDGMKATRGLLRDAEVAAAMVEPPAGVSALLLQEAARRAPAVRAAGAGGGLLGYLAGLLRPMIAHPALAAAATLVIIGGAAGALYLRGAVKVAEPEQTAVLTHADVQQASATAPTPEPSARGAFGAGQPADAPAQANGQVASGEGQTRAGDLDSYRVALDDSKGGPAKEAARNEPGFAATGADGASPLAEREKKKVAVATGSADHAGYLEVDGVQDPPAVRNYRDDSVAGDVGGEGRGNPTATLQTEEQGLAQAVPAAPPPPPPSPLAQLADKNLAKPLAPGGAKPPSLAATTSLAPVAGGAAGPRTQADPAAVAPYNARSDAATLAWAKDQHARMVKLVEAGKCNEVGTLGATVMRRAPDYYQDHVYNDRRIRACRPYIDKSRRAAEPARKAPSPAVDEAVESDKATP